MHSIYDCVKAFKKLLNIRYHIIIGRKGKTAKLDITFHKEDCFHLMGLQYLTDRTDLNQNRGLIFDKIDEHNITNEHVESSDFYYKIQDRIDYLPFLEQFFDSTDSIIRYNQKSNNFSMIQADYLMKSKSDERNIFIFLSKNKDENYFCRSFFPETKYDYSLNQASWTLLHKEKDNLITKEKDIIYDRLKK